MAEERGHIGSWSIVQLWCNIVGFVKQLHIVRRYSNGSLAFCLNCSRQRLTGFRPHCIIEFLGGWFSLTVGGGKCQPSVTCVPMVGATILERCFSRPTGESGMLF